MKGGVEVTLIIIFHHQCLHRRRRGHTSPSSLQTWCPDTDQLLWPAAGVRGKCPWGNTPGGMATWRCPGFRDVFRDVLVKVPNSGHVPNFGTHRRLWCSFGQTSETLRDPLETSLRCAVFSIWIHIAIIYAQGVRHYLFLKSFEFETPSSVHESKKVSEFKIQISLSASFFNICIENGKINTTKSCKILERPLNLNR